MAESIRVEIKAEITDKELLGKALKHFFEDAQLLAYEHYAPPDDITPHDTGHLIDMLAPGASPQWAIDTSDVPTWASVGTNLPYASILNESDAYHYVDGPSQGKKTKGWFERGVQATSGDLDGLLDQLAADIQGAWEKVAK